MAQEVRPVKLDEVDVHRGAGRGLLVADNLRAGAVVGRLENAVGQTPGEAALDAVQHRATADGRRSVRHRQDAGHKGLEARVVWIGGQRERVAVQSVELRVVLGGTSRPPRVIGRLWVQRVVVVGDDVAEDDAVEAGHKLPHRRVAREVAGRGVVVVRRLAGWVLSRFRFIYRFGWY